MSRESQIRNRDFLGVKVKAEEYQIKFSSEEVNALKYIHGESEVDYNPDTRIMGQLAAFCHCADTLSARLWFDDGKGLG